jgi:hypothetical protein
VKKVWLVVALAAFGALAVNTFADVQNIRLSGDIRVRGYYLINAGDDGTGSGAQEKDGTSFISQRTRVSVEADLEDHVLVVVTLRAEGLWGSDDAGTVGSGAGTGTAQNTADRVNRGFDVGIDEAYVQLNEVFYTPATAKLGRQYLNYGRGLILSSYESEYNYDAARLVLDYYPLTLDILGAQLAQYQQFHAPADHAGGANLLFANARYEMTDSFIKDVEAYFGWMEQSKGGAAAVTRVPPSSGGAQPWIIGLRTDMNLTENLSTWLEGTYEGGTTGPNAQYPLTGINACLANAGAKLSFKDATWAPTFNANYTFASSGFVPWFDYVDGHNGYLFHPALHNINIFNLGAAVKPCENTTLAFQAYYYMQANKNGAVGSDPNKDFGPMGAGSYDGSGSRDVGWEIDTILGYDYSKDVRCQLVYAAMIPGKALHNSTEDFDATAHEIRGEVNVKF